VKHRHACAATIVRTMLAASSLFASSTSGARAEETREATFEELAVAAIGKGERVRVAGAYVELLDDEIRLFGSPVKFVVHDPNVRSAALALAGQHRNLAFEAVRVTPIHSDAVYEVVQAEVAPDSSLLFADEIRRLAAGDVLHGKLLFALAERIRQTGRHFKDARLQEVAGQACVEAIRLEESLLPPSDAASRLALVRKAFSICEDATVVVHLLAELERRFPQHEPIRETLHSLGSRNFRGRWLTFDEFKRQQGFERYGSVWVDAREKDFLEAIYRLQTEESDLLVRRRTEAEYSVLASRGEIAVGMNPEEVVEALGYAERVYHRELAGKIYDQWVYRDRLGYFENGLLRHWTASE